MEVSQLLCTCLSGYINVCAHGRTRVHCKNSRVVIAVPFKVEQGLLQTLLANERDHSAKREYFVP